MFLGTSVAEGPVALLPVEGEAYMFSKQSGLDDAFDHETNRVLASAFEEAWSLLQDDPMNIGPHTDSTRELLAKSIIHVAKEGERDEHTLCDAALAFFNLRQLPQF
jgi:hypothetical protein